MKAVLPQHGSALGGQLEEAAQSVDIGAGIREGGERALSRASVGVLCEYVVYMICVLYFEIGIYIGIKRSSECLLGNAEDLDSSSVSLS